MTRHWAYALRVGVLAAVIGLLGARLAIVAFASTPTVTPQLASDCNPCVTVIDRPAYDETVTVVDQTASDEQVSIVDQAAHDETVTIVDAPASTGSRTIVDTPARSVSHHDLVTPATSVARQVLVTPGHYQTVPAYVPAHYERGPDQVVSQGYYTSDWVTSGEYRSVWVWSGYWTSRLVTNGYWGSQWVNDGYYGNVWQPDYYVPWHCWGGPDGDCDGGWWQPGYWYYGWVNTSHWTSVWVDTSYWTSVWVDTSHYETQWIDTSHWGQRWIDTSYTQPTAVLIPAQYVSTSTFVQNGYVQGSGCRYSRIDEDDYCWSAYWVSNAYWVYPTQAWVDPVYTTVYDVVPAVYRDWTETLPAVTHIETYTIPAVSHTTIVHHDAVTHTTTVHHDAVTHTATVHHDAVTHQEQGAAAMSQSRQGGTIDGGTTAATTSPNTPISIPVVSTITLVDQAARTIHHHDLVTAAQTTTRQILVSPARDEAVQTWVGETQARLNTTAGAYLSTFVPAQTGLLWQSPSCYWDADDDGHRSWDCDGGYWYGAVIAPAHYENQWHQGRYVTGRIHSCDDDCYWEYGTQWQDGPFYETVDTSHSVTTIKHTDAVYRTETVTTAAVYLDWDETVAAVTHAETLRYDVVVGSSNSTGPSSGHDDDALGGFALLLTLTALAGAGRFASRGDAVAAATAEWAQTGRPLPPEAVSLLAAGGETTVDAAPAGDAAPSTHDTPTSAGASTEHLGAPPGAEAPGGDSGPDKDKPRRFEPPGWDGIAGAAVAAAEHWNNAVRDASRAMRAGTDAVGEAASQGARMLNGIKSLRVNAAADLVLDAVKSPFMRGLIRGAPFIGAVVTAGDEALNAPGPATPGNVAKTWARAMIRIGFTALGTTLGALATAALGFGTGGVGAVLLGAGIITASTLAGDALGSMLARSIPFLQNDEDVGSPIAPLPDLPAEWQPGGIRDESTRAANRIPADVSGWASDPMWSAGGVLDESSRAAMRSSATAPDPTVADTSGWASDPLWSAGGFLDESSRASRRSSSSGADGTPGGSSNPSDGGGDVLAATDGSSNGSVPDIGDWFPALTEPASNDDAASGDSADAGSSQCESTTVSADSAELAA